jgi:hypothetical protein
MAKQTTQSRYSPDPVAEKLAADRAHRNRLHPAPWQLDSWASGGTIKYRVLDAIGNPITEPTGDRASQVFVVEARNEAYEEHCDHVIELWAKNAEELKADTMRIHGKWQEEVGRLGAALNGARHEIDRLKKENSDMKKSLLERNR